MQKSNKKDRTKKETLRDKKRRSKFFPLQSKSLLRVYQNAFLISCPRAVLLFRLEAPRTSPVA